MKITITNAILTIALTLTVLSVKSQTVKNASHFFFYESNNDFHSDSISITETVYLTNFNDSIQKYYRIEFNNSLNHILEIMIYNNDTVGILTTYYYEVKEVRLTKKEKKSIQARRIKKFNYNILTFSDYISKNNISNFIESIENANLNTKNDRNIDGFQICGGKRQFNIIVKSQEETKSLAINESSLIHFDLKDNLIPVIYLLLDYTDRNNFYNEKLPINQMFKAKLRENYGCIKLKKKVTICKPIY